MKNNNTITLTENLLTPAEVAKMLCVDVRTVYKWARSGNLEAYKAGNRALRIEKAALIRFLRRK